MLRDEYFAEVAELAKSITAEAREYDRDISEQLWETVDSHEYVIYTAKAQRVLAFSPNDGAFVETFGSDGLVNDGCLNWSGLAYSAMEADIRAHSAFNAEPDEDEVDPDAKCDYCDRRACGC